MKRLELEKLLRAHGCKFSHRGGGHDIWINPVTLAQAPIPRHREIKTGTARSICQDLGVPFPHRR